MVRVFRVLCGTACLPVCAWMCACAVLCAFDDLPRHLARSHNTFIVFRYNAKVIAVEDPAQEGDEYTYFVKYADGSKIGGVGRSHLRPRTSRRRIKSKKSGVEETE